MESNKLNNSVVPPCSYKIICCLLLLLSAINSVAFCQTGDEIFNQKKTQIRYLLEQAAALKVYSGYLRKGYEIVGNGIHTFKDIKNGEFDLHNTFINSLEKVNPAIRNSNKIIDIIAFQVVIRKCFSAITGNTHLSATDKEHISRVKKKVNVECNTDLEELLLVITSGRVEMRDDERIKRLDKVYESMKDKSSFTQSFCNQTAMLISQREQEANEIKYVKKLYGITQ